MKEELGVLYAEGVASHGGPESCAAAREGWGEALTGVRAGRAIEPRNHMFRGCPRCRKSGRQHLRQRYARAAAGPRAVTDPWHVRNLHAREPGEPGPARPRGLRAGRSGNAEAVILG